MDTLRKRIPFKFSESPQELGEVNDGILDEQEQEELIHSLRQANISSNEWYLMLLRIVLGLSFLLQLISLVNSPYNNPLLSIFPSESPGMALSIPYPVLATLLSLVVHANLAILAFPGDLGIHPISFQFLYVIATVAPTLSLFLRRPWQSTIWWSLTVAVVFIVHTVTGSIDDGNKSIAELETKKYVAPGA